MNIEQIPIITVSYNSPELIEILLRSIRQFYDNRVYIVDGSADQVVDEIKQVTNRFDNVEFIPFGYNIHHGPGMAWAIKNLNLSGPVLFLDSDVEIITNGFLESLLSHLTPDLYGVGDVCETSPTVLKDVPPGTSPFGYLTPLCMLCNIDVMRNWPLPIKHGAPMISSMFGLYEAGKSDLIRHVDWVRNDYSPGTTKIFIRHDWQGTVRRTGGYHYDTDIGKQDYNGHLLSFLPTNAQQVMEIGCNNGALARAYKKLNPICHYTGVEIDMQAVRQARMPCDFVFNMDIESADEHFFQDARHIDCWILPEVLAYLKDPWSLLAKINKVIPANGSIIASIPNMQHWSMQARLNSGNLNYEAKGLLKRGHLRWFSRNAIVEMFAHAGFQISAGIATIGENADEKILSAIRVMAEHAGIDPVVAVQDAIPLEYIIKAVRS
jgi:2-polyprenyl-3-methyl-5-hydroxy-6-metoxy-1,4-benzoquinol methylase